MKHRSRRMGLLAAGAAALCAALLLAAVGLRRTAAFFVTPSELVNTDANTRTVRVGGLVELGSVSSEGAAVTFRLVDDLAGVQVRYAGVLPNLFREGQCVIAEGRRRDDGAFEADRVLAKHDETYVPREIESAGRLAASCGSVAGSDE